MAYLYNTYKETFYAFDSLELPGTKVTNNNHKVVLTVAVSVRIEFTGRYLKASDFKGAVI